MSRDFLVLVVSSLKLLGVKLYMFINKLKRNIGEKKSLMYPTTQTYPRIKACLLHLWLRSPGVKCVCVCVCVCVNVNE